VPLRHPFAVLFNWDPAKNEALGTDTDGGGNAKKVSVPPRAS